MSFLFLFPYFVLARQNLDEGIKALTEQINKYMVEKNKTIIAIIPFSDIQKQRVNAFGSFIAEELTTNLFMTGKFKIVERTLLRQLLDELKLGQTGVIETKSAKELGKIAGVEAIIAGTITDLGSAIAINCRLIETESGEVFAAAKARIKKDRDIEKMLNEGNLIAEKKADVTVPQQEQKDQNIHFKNSIIAHDFMFEVKECTKRANLITVVLVITNIVEDEILFIGFSNTSITDNNGNVFGPYYIILGNKGFAGNVYTSLAKDIPVKCTLKFEASRDSNSIALLDLSCMRGDPFISQYNSQRRFRAQLRNIPILE